MAGGRTGRDGVGGATVASKEITSVHQKTAGAHVQKGNPVEERKFQRLMTDPRFTRIIKKCNDFGAGGVCISVGELSRGVTIDLDQVNLHSKYAGLSDTELAVAESQERMSYVIDPKDEEVVLSLFKEYDIEAFKVGEVTTSEKDADEDRMIMML
jgi:phosphoribosylformylglycinamidine synthase